MNTRWNRSVVALSASLFCLAFTPALLAQEPTPAPPEEEQAPAPAPPEAAADTPKEDAKLEAPKEDPAKAEAGGLAAASASTEVKPGAPEPAPVPASNPERERATSLIGIERLPGSAFPTPRTRGITGGSLWLTMHGLQWPYMPAYAGQPALRLGISGSIWTDGSYARTISGLEDAYQNQKRLAVQGRAVLRATPTYSTESGWFGQGQMELVAQGNMIIQGQTMGYTDDLWVRAGKWNSFDLTVGRFQGYEIANHYGMGLDLNTFERSGAGLEKQADKPNDAYGLTYFWDRRDGNVGNYAFHLYPAGWFKLPADLLRIELLGQFGAGTNDGQAIQTNFRPAGILDLGIVKVKGGFEYGKSIHQLDGEPANTTRNGYGVALQLVLDPYVEGGIGFAQGWEDFVNDQNVYQRSSSNKATGVSGFLNARVYKALIVGGGLVNGHKVYMATDERPTSEHFGEADYDNHFQTFGAVQYSFWDSLFIKFVAAYSNWYHQDRSSTPFTNKQLSGRLRFMILY